MSKNPLLEEIEDFLAARRGKMTETAFGLAVMNDGKFVTELKNGRRVLIDTADKVRAYIAAENQNPTEAAAAASPENDGQPVPIARAG